MDFGPGEVKKDILLPIMNDNQGGVLTFQCQLTNVQSGGPGKIGVIGDCTVNIENIPGQFEDMF